MSDFHRYFPGASLLTVVVSAFLGDSSPGTEVQMMITMHVGGLLPAVECLFLRSAEDLWQSQSINFSYKWLYWSDDVLRFPELLAGCQFSQISYQLS